VLKSKWSAGIAAFAVAALLVTGTSGAYATEVPPPVAEEVTPVETTEAPAEVAPEPPTAPVAEAPVEVPADPIKEEAPVAEAPVDVAAPAAEAEVLGPPSTPVDAPVAETPVETAKSAPVDAAPAAQVAAAPIEVAPTFSVQLDESCSTEATGGVNVTLDATLQGAGPDEVPVGTSLEFFVDEVSNGGSYVDQVGQVASFGVSLAEDSGLRYVQLLSTYTLNGSPVSEVIYGPTPIVTDCLPDTPTPVEVDPAPTATIVQTIVTGGVDVLVTASNPIPTNPYEYTTSTDVTVKATGGSTTSEILTIAPGESESYTFHLLNNTGQYTVQALDEEKNVLASVVVTAPIVVAPPVFPTGKIVTECSALGVYTAGGTFSLSEDAKEASEVDVYLDGFNLDTFEVKPGAEDFAYTLTDGALKILNDNPGKFVLEFAVGTHSITRETIDSTCDAVGKDLTNPTGTITNTVTSNGVSVSVRVENPSPDAPNYATDAPIRVEVDGQVRFTHTIEPNGGVTYPLSFANNSGSHKVTVIYESGSGDKVVVEKTVVAPTVVYPTGTIVEKCVDGKYVIQLVASYEKIEGAEQAPWDIYGWLDKDQAAKFTIEPGATDKVFTLTGVDFSVFHQNPYLRFVVAGNVELDAKSINLFDIRACENPPVEPTIVIPLPPQFVDECGIENDVVQVPSDTTDVTYEVTLDGNTAIVTATASEGIVFDEEGTTSLTWSHTFTDEPCPVTPTDPPTPTPPTTPPTTDQPTPTPAVIVASDDDDNDGWSNEEATDHLASTGLDATTLGKLLLVLMGGGVLLMVVAWRLRRRRSTE